MPVLNEFLSFGRLELDGAILVQSEGQTLSISNRIGRFHGIVGTLEPRPIGEVIPWAMWLVQVFDFELQRLQKFLMQHSEGHFGFQFLDNPMSFTFSDHGCIVLAST